MRYGLSAEERIERFDLQGGAISESSRPRREWRSGRVRQRRLEGFAVCAGALIPPVSGFESGRVEEFGNEGTSFTSGVKSKVMAGMGPADTRKRSLPGD
jgi:hypothetical protein